MTFNDLEQALSDTIASGKIGTPVSLRVHLQVPDSTLPLNSLLAEVIRFGQPLLEGNPASLAARRNDRQSQLSLLLTCDRGRTILATVGIGSSDRLRMQLLLIGNHGIVRLEGEDQLESLPDCHEDNATSWETAIRQSLEKRAQIPLINEQRT